MLHNGARAIPSEIVEFDRGFRKRRRTTLSSPGCHDIVRLEDGRFLYCESFKGQLACDDGTKFKIDELYTRGLSVGEDEIAVGSSLYGKRLARALLPGFRNFSGSLLSAHRAALRVGGTDSDPQAGWS